MNILAQHDYCAVFTEENGSPLTVLLLAVRFNKTMLHVIESLIIGLSAIHPPL